jgi:hypothetical protein
MFLAVNLSPPGAGPREALRVASVVSLTDATSNVGVDAVCPDALKMVRITLAAIRVFTILRLITGDDE